MHRTLRWQFDWRGNAIANLRILVDHKCEDVPNPQLRPIIVGPDPYPVRDPRPGFAASQMGGIPPPLSFVVPTLPPKYLFEQTDQGEVIDDDQGNPIRIIPPPLDPALSFGLANNAGVLRVTSPNYWPVSPVGLARGDLWSVAGLANVVPWTAPDPAAPPVIFGTISATALLALGGSNLPLSDPHVVGQLWNDGDIIHVSAG